MGINPYLLIINNCNEIINTKQRVVFKFRRAHFLLEIIAEQVMIQCFAL